MDYALARSNMVESQVRTNDVPDVAIQDAMGEIARERFVMPARAALAYADRFVEYAPAYWLMPPRDVAKLLHAARPQAGERALAIAAPYAAAVLARLGLEVTVREAPAAVDAVREALAGERVRVTSGDLAEPEGGFDLVVSEGAVAALDAWLAALAPGGRLAAVVRRGAVGKATLVTHAARTFGAREVFDSTPPWLPGFEPRAEFVF